MSSKKGNSSSASSSFGVRSDSDNESSSSSVSSPSSSSSASSSSPSVFTSLSTSFFRAFLASEVLFQSLILFAICILAFMCRLFSVVRYESVIHEFDPWFNFRTTRYLVDEGFYEFHNWFDDLTWYPLGRFIGGTVYPGLMWTAAIGYHLLHLLHFTVDIRNVCVLLAPFMAANTSIATYLFTKEVWNGSAGIFAAAFISIAPGYISRSVAGSYDNEACAIFALIFCFYLWVKAVKTGSMLWGAASALGYFYMVAAWGGYIFIINLIPAHVFVLLISGRYSHRLYIAYCTFYTLGTLLSMQILFVSFQPVSSPEHLAAFGIFCLLQIYNSFYWLQSMLPAADLKILGRWLLVLSVCAVFILLLLAITGTIPFLTGRLWALLGATSNIAIVKSVSEHQPSPWTTFFFDLHCVVFLVPVGIYFCFAELNDANAFAILYVVFASYFSSIMVRLVLVLTPGACVLAAIGASVTMQNYCEALTAPRGIKQLVERSDKSAKGSGNNNKLSSETLTVRVPRVSAPVASLVITAMTLLFLFFVVHCNWVTSTAYSSPSIVLQATGHDGSLIIFDDFREAYSWLRHNTPEDAKIVSWWDYGYQITGMGNRAVIVDNNTRNNTHIANVGLIMASTEERAWPIMRALDVDYALVVFGGKVGYSSDDINKFLWMVRISGGIYPEVVESDYFNTLGQYRMDHTVSPRMMNSMMYKMCYYKFGELQTHYGRPAGYDLVRGSEIGNKNIQLEYLEEAFTTTNAMVRIYRVKTEESHPNFLDKLRRQKL